MACTSCSESVEKALQMIDGVKRAIVGLALEEAKVHYDPSLVDPEKIIEAVEDAGFGAELISSGNDANKAHLKLEGIDSEEDANVLVSYLELAAGVNRVEMDLLELIVTVSYDPDFTGPRTLIHCVQEASRGSKVYQATLYSPSGRREKDKVNEIRMYRDQFLFSCLFSVPVFMFAMVLPMLPPYGNWLNYKVHNMLTLGLFLRWILCTPVQFIVGKRYYCYYNMIKPSFLLPLLFIICLKMV
jgi:Cu+-exporting ATPase